MELMQGLAITNKGLEEVSAGEIAELLNCRTTARAGTVVFECKSVDDLFRACYSSRSVAKVLLLLDEFEGFTLELLEKRIAQLDFKGWLSENDSFAVRCEKDTRDFAKQEIESEAGAFILKQVSAKVDLKNPDITFFVFLSGRKCYFGIDFSGEDLARRDYRIFLSTNEIKGSVAFAMLKLAGYDANKVLLDPNCRSGVILIEAALYARRQSPHFFSKEKFLFRKITKFRDFGFEKFFAGVDAEQLPDAETSIFAVDSDFRGVSAAKKNAKIAGVSGNLQFSHAELERLDDKFDKETVDCIVSVPPQLSRLMPEKKIENYCLELFNQADFLLKKNGWMVLAVKRGAGLLKQHSAKFRLEQELSVMQGSEELKLLRFTKP